MNQTVTIEIPAANEALVRQLLAVHEELQALALSAAEGTVLDACEAAVAPKGARADHEPLNRRHRPPDPGGRKKLGRQT